MWNLLPGDRRACSPGGGKPAEARVGRAEWAEDFRVEFLSGIGSQPRERAKEKHLYSRNPRQTGEKAWWVRALAALDKDLGSVSRTRMIAHGHLLLSFWRSDLHEQHIHMWCTYVGITHIHIINK